MRLMKSDASNNTDETRDLLDLIRDVVPDPNRWLSENNKELGGRRPIDMLEGDAADRVREFVRAIKYWHSDMKLSACASLATYPLSGTWYRAIQLKFLPTALSTSHTQTIPSRFNAGSLNTNPFETLYLAENHQVALFEVRCSGRRRCSCPTPIPHGCWSMPR